jgi:hypothetical protein
MCLTIFWTFVPQFYIIILLQFKLQGNEIRRETASDNEGRLAADKNLHSSKLKDVRQKVKKLNGSYQHLVYQDLEKKTCQKQKVKKLNGSYQHLVYQDLEKKTCQKRQNTDGDEIEEGELIEEDHQDTVPESKLNKPRKAVLRSVIKASSAGQLESINASSKDVSDKGATRECDDKHILAVLEKMQKRRDRFKEPVVTQKEEDGGNTEQLAVACIAGDVKNQRPTRKRRWGGNG